MFSGLSKRSKEVKEKKLFQELFLLYHLDNKKRS